MASAEADRQEEEEEVVAAPGDEEDTGAHVAPVVRLEEVAVTTGEEDEDALIDLKAKLYRFDKEGKQWKERGNGSVKILKHKETGRFRVVMRQAKTLKICANHLVLPSTRMQEHAGNDKSCVWHAMDFSDGVLKEEMFAIRFGSVENCKRFMEMIEGIISDSFGRTEEKDSKDALSASRLIEKLSVTEPENKTDTKEASVVNDDKRVKEHQEKRVESERSSSTSELVSYR